MISEQPPPPPPTPWVVVEISTGWMVLDANLQIIATIFGKDGLRDENGSRLTRAEACRIATDISRLPELLNDKG